MDRQNSVGQLRAAVEAFTKTHLVTGDQWCVALSGGPDSLALTAVAAPLRPTTALIVDHGLQPDTLDDQAETVLLGLGRGSGARSMAGMRPHHPPWCRPLLGVRRTTTHAACRELGLTAWQDPHNSDRRFTRTRLRHEVLPLLEDVLGGGVAEALARTATALREDTEFIDTLAAQALPGVRTDSGLAAQALATLPGPVRRRVIRGWLLAGGATGLTDKQIRGVDALVTAWRGQGGVAVGSDLRGERLIAGRRDGVLTLRREPV
jgi:tRNA(Ile)-lysidine synthase